LVLAAAAVILVEPVANLILPTPPAPDPTTIATPDIELATRFGIAIQSAQPDDADSSSVASGLMPSLTNARTDPAGITDRDARLQEIVAHIRVAFASGEIEGAESALQRIAALDPVAQTLDPNDEAESAILTDLAHAHRIYIEGPASLDTDARDRLIERHGTMGRIALVHGTDRADPDRRAIVRSAMAAAIAVGLVLALAIVMRASGRLPMRFRPDRESDARTHNVFLETAIVFLAAFAAYKVLAVTLAEVLPNAAMALAAAEIIGLGVLALIPFWPLVRGVDRATMFRSMGWTRGRGVLREILAGIATYLAFFPVVIAGFAAMIVLIQVFGFAPSHPIVDQFSQGSPITIALLYLLAAVWAPVVEESIFRGALFHHSRRFVGFLISALLAAFVFAAIHPQGIGGIPPLMALAIGFAACREWRGSLIGSITAHAIHNAVIVTFGLFVLG
jgi:membrane protease YdiL (CAAX protease family)